MKILIYYKSVWGTIIILFTITNITIGGGAWFGRCEPSFLECQDEFYEISVVR